MSGFKVTRRVSGKVTHEHYEEFDAAFGALERTGHQLQGVADAESVGGSLMRRFEAADQVTARLELSGKGVHGGVDVRGDGSAIPFTGRFMRKQVERRDGESAYDALRRAIR